MNNEENRNEITETNQEEKKQNIIKVVIIVLLLLFLFLLCIGAGMHIGKKSDPAPNPNDGNIFIVDDRAVDKNEAIVKKENPLAGRNVFFAGYADAVLSKSSTVALENLPDNQEFFIKYTITDTATGSIVFETNLIASGQCVVWTPGETLETGTYDLQFLATPYFQKEDGNYMPLTAGSNTVCYTIE